MCSSFHHALNPSTIITDFEIGLQIATCKSWPNAKLLGCRFHLTQAWYRKIQKLGLAKEYNNELSEIGSWLRHLFGLQYLDPNDVEDCFVMDLAPDQPADQRVTEFADYLVEHYLDGEFPPNMWAEEGTSQEHTTNACESFHSKFGEQFYHAHPSIIHFTEVLKMFQTQSYIKINSINDGARKPSSSSSRRQNIIKSKLKIYKKNEISRYDFVKFCSYFTKIRTITKKKTINKLYTNMYNIIRYN